MRMMSYMQHNPHKGLLFPTKGGMEIDAYIDAAWLDRMPPMQDMEDAMLDSAVDRRENSRLSCQIEVSDALDGLVVTIADNAA